MNDYFVIEDVKAELADVREQWPPMASLHEGYAILKEEVDEFWDEVKRKEADQDPLALYEELIQVAAMAVKTASDCLNVEYGDYQRNFSLRT